MEDPLARGGGPVHMDRTRRGQTSRSGWYASRGRARPEWETDCGERLLEILPGLSLATGLRATPQVEAAKKTFARSKLHVNIGTIGRAGTTETASLFLRAGAPPAAAPSAPPCDSPGRGAPSRRAADPAREPAARPISALAPAS
jgi:hypothetical protein